MTTTAKPVGTVRRTSDREKQADMDETADASRSGERKARLIDVAHLAKVSRATAARVLGGYAKVGDKRSDRVFSAARELDYRTNEIARAMRAGRTLTIGVVVADISNSFFGSAIRAIIDAAAHAGYQTLIINSNEDHDKEIEAVHTLLEKRVDGLIVVPSFPIDNGHLDPAATAMVPTVFLDRRIDIASVPAITSDDRGGASAAIAHLLSLGHERIGVIAATSAVRTHASTAPEHLISTVADRIEGVLRAHAMAGLPFDQRLLRYSRSDPACAQEAAAMLLSDRHPVTAILTTNEETTIGTLAACDALGLKVGWDLSLVSFDDSPWAAVYSPPLTVIRRPVYEMGVAAVECLLRALAGNPSTETTVMPNALIERRSVRDNSTAATDPRSGRASASHSPKT